MMNKRRNTYIAAEAGINFNGRLENCYRLIDSAADAGCDAAKFQLFKAGYLYPKSAGRLDWKDNRRKYSYDIYDASKRFELPESWLPKIIRYCGKRGIEFLCSACDRYSLDVLISLGLKRIKLPSCVVTNIPLIERCARKVPEIIISTGGATLAEVEEAVTTAARYHRDISLLHCSITYPTALRDCNMGVMETLRLAFPGIPIGYSDHTKEVSEAAVQAVYLGAGIIEKHITLDKNMEGPDHFFALEPDELKKMVKDIRTAEKRRRDGDAVIDKRIYGDTAKITYPRERRIRDFAFMRLFAGRDIRAGERIREKDISVLRPGKKGRGLEPKFLKLFRENAIYAKRDIGFEEPVSWGDIL